MPQKFCIASVVLACFVVAACTVHQTDAPGFTGPSERATALSISANPDTVALGPSWSAPGQPSLVAVTVYDENGKPKPGQHIRFETLVNGQPSDCGQLSTATGITGADGRADTVFTAPGLPPDCPNFSTDGSVTIRATPVGTDFQSSSSGARTASIYIAPPLVTEVVGGLIADFSIYPNPARVNQDVSFVDTSFSPGHVITDRSWTFSDGSPEIGPSPMHDFGVAGTYIVTLWVKDDLQQESSKTKIVTIVP